MKQPGFFDVEERLVRLSWLDDQLEAFSRTVDFEVFRPDLNKALVCAERRLSADVRLDPGRNTGGGSEAAQSQR